jgi:hypothetical protein
VGEVNTQSFDTVERNSSDDILEARGTNPLETERIPCDKVTLSAF